MLLIIIVRTEEKLFIEKICVTSITWYISKTNLTSMYPDTGNTILIYLNKIHYLQNFKLFY